MQIQFVVVVVDVVVVVVDVGMSLDKTLSLLGESSKVPGLFGFPKGPTCDFEIGEFQPLDLKIIRLAIGIGGNVAAWGGGKFP